MGCFLNSRTSNSIAYILFVVLFRFPSASSPTSCKHSLRIPLGEFFLFTSCIVDLDFGSRSTVPTSNAQIAFPFFDLVCDTVA